MFWEYISARGQREFSVWRDGLPKVERALLDEKMRAIEAMGLGVSCLKMNLRGYRHLGKIRVQAPTQALRPLLCRGPQNKDGEFTMLMPMTEVGGADIPRGAKDEAERRRQLIAVTPSSRVRYEVPKP